MRHLVSRSSFEGDIIQYYEIFFYSDQKQYVKDVVSYISECIGGIKNKRILDIGCGTGIFDEYFAEAEADVLAIDISEDMINYAKQNHREGSIVYQVHDICKSAIKKKNDVAIAMSHVIGYQLENTQLRNFLKNISECLVVGSLFLFNFYNEPAILLKELIPQFREVRVDEITITRISNVVEDYMKNALRMKYRYIIEKEGEETIDIKIEEKMRYYSLMELDNYLHNAGFRIKKAVKFLSKEELLWNEWNGFIVAEKID